VWGPRLQTALVVSGSAVVALYAGNEVAEGGPDNLSKPLLGLAALAGAAVIFSITPEKLFLGWLFLAPLFQNSADATTVGRPLTLGLYLAPAVALVCHTAVRWRSDIRVRFVDAFPALYAIYVLASIAVTTSLLTSDPFGTAKAYFGTAALSAVIYYFVVFGPGSRIPAQSIARVLLLAALLQAIFSVVEWQSGWNLWGDRAWHASHPPRTVGTLVSPAALGMFIGVGIVVAAAALAWEGPSRLRRLAWAMVLFGVPGLFATLTRAPVLATAVAVVAVTLLGRRSRVIALCAITSVALATFVLWPTLTASDVYTERISNRVNVEVRAEVQRVSVQLAAERPLTGWGYGSFDEAKASLGRELGVDEAVLANTSHNAFLTILVEYGALGLSLFLLPIVVVSMKGVNIARHPSARRWFLVGCLGAVLVFGLAAQSGDFRYYSFAQLLPFLFVGLIRREFREGDDTSTS
jgi:O-antigen ligase